MGVNSLPKTVTRQCRDCDLHPGPSAPESSMLTVTLKMHDLKMTDKILANCEHSYGVWKMQEYKSS